MANNIRHDKLARLSAEEDCQHGKRVFSEKTGARHSQTINHLVNWRYYNPIFLFQGYHDMFDSGTFYPIFDNKIKRDAANPDRRVAIVVDRYAYDDAFSNKRIEFGEPTFTNRWRCTDANQSLNTQTPLYDDVYSNYPEVYVSGEEITSGAWEPLVYTPSGNLTYGLVDFRNMRFFGFGLYEVPDSVVNLTAEQMGCQAKETDYNRIIKGTDATFNGTNYGNLWNYLGNTIDNVDTVECMTRRQWQYCHPKGIYMDSILTPTNIFNGLTIKLRPRQILDDSSVIPYKCAAVAGGENYEITFTNTTIGHSVTIANSGTWPGRTLDQANDDLNVQRGIDNEIEITCYTGGGASVLIHSVAMFEGNPW